MAVKTYKQYQDGVKKAPSEVKQKIKVVKKQKKLKITEVHYLMYPENTRDENFNGEYPVDYKGEIKTLWINNGAIQTSDNELKALLLSKGFIFMKTIKKEEI